MDLVHSDKELTWDECHFVLTHYQESANHLNSQSGAFFTPHELAQSFIATTIGCGDGSIIDLCAGIGMLSWHSINSRTKREITCVEINPDYVEVGKRVVPQVNWVCASVFDLDKIGNGYDWAMSNPPFGNINRRGKNSPRYSGAKFEYHVFDIASHVAKFGAFIAPKESFPFRYSGERSHRYESNSKHLDFVKRTNIKLNCASVDTSFAKKLWNGVSPDVEIGYCDFNEYY
jgi:hypothetical protein